MQLHLLAGIANRRDGLGEVIVAHDIRRQRLDEEDAGQTMLRQGPRLIADAEVAAGGASEHGAVDIGADVLGTRMAPDGKLAVYREDYVEHVMSMPKEVMLYTALAENWPFGRKRQR